MTETSQAVPLDQYVTQTQIADRWPWLSVRRLSDYRREKRVRWLEGKNGEFIYPLPDLERAVTEDLEGVACQEKAPPSNTADSGSEESTEAPSGIDSGTTPVGEELVSRALEQVISKKPSHASSLRSRKHRTRPTHLRQSRC